MTRVLVLNCGSSSVRYKLFDGDDVTAKGHVERIGEDGGEAADHLSALRDLLDRLDLSGLAAVGHRVVHGGERFTASTVITDEVVAAVEELIPLAPLHNPGALTGIRVARKLLPDVPQVAVFDTAFHATIPPEGVLWAVDRELARRYGLRRYGFHGTSHAYVSRETARILGKPVAGTNVITLHLGNGASAAAVRGGRCEATSMGMTPLPGLVMGTRSGDVDPSLIFHLHRVGGLGLDEIEESLTRRGGLLGLTGDNDMRSVLDRRAAGDEEAALAFAIYARRLREYVGSYLAVLGRVDAITFTAGVGERSAVVRAAALEGLEPLGISVDPARNEAGELIISPDGAPIAVCVVPTDEEREIANESRRALSLEG
ncbi:acetate kinase [Actinoplanes ianthinogenes]|uniref:Acetate kinase n=1 Tax=Actinoplanes ianthinogenes TaxID=122358 RepID=A0ABN6CB30_9ACTN|nr:acetate kinase [Actinoplanes ianthinogenes]BCJ42727.1 acetate kinase [Actinoplanes ianthinogenes]GGQ92616.1 acetate kinase [Actinoplanes ianthinogenes]